MLNNLRVFFLLISIPFALSAQSDALRVGILSDISDTDPREALDSISSAVLYNVFENLVTFKDDSLEIIPSLATSWTHSDDNIIWTYRLRENVMFHNGKPLNADTVVESFGKAPNFTATVTKVDDMTVKFTLRSGNSHFNDYLAQSYYAIVPSGYKQTDLPVGTGPFIFRERIRGKNITLEANSNWWKGNVGVKKVEFIIFPNQDALLQAVIDKKIDLAEWLTSEAVLKLRKYAYLHVESTLGSNTAFLSINVNKKPLDNPKIRQAISHSINVVALARQFFPGASGAPASTVIPPTLFRTMMSATPYDPVKAKKLIAESGVDISKPIFLLEGWAPRPYMPAPHEIALEVEKYLEDVGFNIQVVSDPDNYFNRIRSGAVDLCLNGWIADNGDPAEFISANFHSSSIGHNNVSRWSNPTFDDLIDQARVLEGIQLKVKLTQALELIRDETPAIPLFWGGQSAVWNSRVKNYNVHPSSQILLPKVTLNGPGK